MHATPEVRQVVAAYPRRRRRNADTIFANFPTVHVHPPLRRLWLAGFLVLAFLTVQLAAAAYACMGSRYALDQTGDMAGMTESCPEMSQQAQPAQHAQHAGDTTGVHDGLCLEHCQLGAKTVDHASPQIPVFLPVLLSVVELTPAPTTDHFALVYGDAMPRAPPPPLSILHCCYRT